MEINAILAADNLELPTVGERLGFLDVITLDRHDFSRYRTRNRKAFTNHFPERT